MGEERNLKQLQIDEFAELVGLSFPQPRRYDRLRLLEPAARSAESGYRFYSRGQTGAARIIAVLRSMDVPIAEIRRIIVGASEAGRRRIFSCTTGLVSRCGSTRSAVSSRRWTP